MTTNGIQTLYGLVPIFSLDKVKHTFYWKLITFTPALRQIKTNGSLNI